MNGRISEQDFKQYAAFLKKKMQQSANSAFDRNSFNASVNTGEVNYDEQKQVLRVVTMMSVPNLGLMRSIDVVFLTESGMLTFKFTSAEKEYGQYADLFSRVIASIERPRGVQTLAVAATRSPPLDGSAGKNTADNNSAHYISKQIGVWIVLIVIGAFCVGKSKKKQTKKGTDVTPADNEPKSS